MCQRLCWRSGHQNAPTPLSSSSRLATGEQRTRQCSQWLRRMGVHDRLSPSRLPVALFCCLLLSSLRLLCQSPHCRHPIADVAFKTAITFPNRRCNYVRITLSPGSVSSTKASGSQELEIVQSDPAVFTLTGQDSRSRQGCAGATWSSCTLSVTCRSERNPPPVPSPHPVFLLLVIHAPPSCRKLTTSATLVTGLHPSHTVFLWDTRLR